MKNLLVITLLFLVGCSNQNDSYTTLNCKDLNEQLADNSLRIDEVNKKVRWNMLPAVDYKYLPNFKNQIEFTINEGDKEKEKVIYFDLEQATFFYWIINEEVNEQHVYLCEILS